jgi:hypothetical protein
VIETSSADRASGGPRSVSTNKCWVVGCAWHEKLPRLAKLARYLMPMNARSWSVCAGRTLNCVWTVIL